MNYNLEEATEILSRTPDVLRALLGGLSHPWTHRNEGLETWSPYHVVGHLIHAEQTNWMPRAKGILGHPEQYAFEPFNRTAMFEESKHKTLETLLEEFAVLREQNLVTLRDFKLTEPDFEKTGIHPEFGKVRLRELLATWVVHDLSHLRQIVRTMAKQYETEVGPWRAYLSILQK
jgi:DinB superfamily